MAKTPKFANAKVFAWVDKWNKICTPDKIVVVKGTKKDWKPCSFTVPDSDVPVNAISVPAGAGFTTSIVYLLPSSPTNAFFRVRAE